MKKIQNAVVAPLGFKVNGIHSGVKKRNPDLSLIVSDRPCEVAGVFTRNLVKAAPLVLDQEIIAKNNKISAIVINSGNANACTGQEGYANAKRMVKEAEKVLGLTQDTVLVASTGVIGVQLQMEKILKGIEVIAQDLNNTPEKALLCNQGIMTTDTFVKGIAFEIMLSGKSVKIGGIAKGSGMIHPNMGTMLGFITTDCDISGDMLKKALYETTDATYNMISVDGDTSTNDMAVVIANGLAENKCIDTPNQDFDIFKNALNEVNKYLATQIVLDGEGATKFLETTVVNAKSVDDARKLAKTVISSSLVKTAFFGEDANWGRILASMGRSGVPFDQSKVDIEFKAGDKSVCVMREGTPVKFDEEQTRDLLKNKCILITITLQDGHETATAWGCDLSYEYVRINGEYRT